MSYSVNYNFPSTSTGWIAAPVAARKQLPPSYQIWDDGTIFRADNMKGGADLQSVDHTDAQSVFNSACAGGGLVEVKKPVGANYPIKSQFNMVSNGQLIAEQGTVIQAAASMTNMLGYSGGSIARSYVSNIRFDCNSLATSSINWSQTEISAINRISNCIVSNSLGKAWNFDGNEDTLFDFDLVELSCADGMSWSIPSGKGAMLQYISNVPLTGTDLAGSFQMLTVDQSVLNSINLGRTNTATIHKTYLANRPCQIISTNATGVETLTVDGCYIGLGNSKSMFQITMLRNGITFKNTYVINLDGSTSPIFKVLGVLAQSGCLVENVFRAGISVNPWEDPANVANIVTRMCDSKLMPGIFFNSVDNTNKVLSFYTGTTNAPNAASTTYKVKHANGFITSAGGTGVSITVNDANGTPVTSGVATLTRFPVYAGYTVNFGSYSVAPTVTMEWTW